MFQDIYAYPVELQDISKKGAVKQSPEVVESDMGIKYGIYVSLYCYPRGNIGSYRKFRITFGMWEIVEAIVRTKRGEIIYERAKRFKMKTSDKVMRYGFGILIIVVAIVDAIAGNWLDIGFTKISIAGFVQFGVWLTIRFVAHYWASLLIIAVGVLWIVFYDKIASSPKT